MPRSKKQGAVNTSRKKGKGQKNISLILNSCWHYCSFYFRHLAFIGVLAGIAYWMWLDHEVAKTFETRRWALPSRVYAAPLEIYEGKYLNEQRLVRELELLGYEETNNLEQPGQYILGDKKVSFFSRGFNYWDIPESSKRVSVEFFQERIIRLRSIGSVKELSLMRLEPAEIGTINSRSFEDRKLLSLDEIPSDFVEALIAVEDRRFEEHFGVDIFAVARAMLANIKAGRFVQGGSTLTQQLVKNFYLTRERTLSRKFTEMLMAISLEARYDKSLIVETYINEVFLGQDGSRAIHGFGLASYFYFGKPLSELDLTSMATLIGMVKGPSAYDPRKNPERSVERRNLILSVMQREKMIRRGSYIRLSQMPLKMNYLARSRSELEPAIAGLVRSQLEAHYSEQDLKTAGLNIFTTLDPILQGDAGMSIADQIEKMEASRKIEKGLQAAAVVVHPASGEILTLVGGRESKDAGFNRALYARRPIGSMVKPFIYAHALSFPERFNLLSQILDEEFSWKDNNGEIWAPRNFDEKTRGRISLLESLTQSLNLATVNLGMSLGIDNVRDALHSFGLKEDIPAYPSILLGALEMTPIQLAESYTSLANGGFRVPLRAISEVTDGHGQKLSRYGLRFEKVMEPYVARLIRHSMERVVQKGTARSLSKNFPDAQPLAGKTGTSNDNRDSWFVGFGANRLGVVWIGRDDNGVTRLTGSSGAVPVWTAMMKNTVLEPLGITSNQDLKFVSARVDTFSVVPSGCLGAELVPVHRLSVVKHSRSCSGERAIGRNPVAREGRTFLDTVRGFFQ